MVCHLPDNLHHEQTCLATSLTVNVENVQELMSDSPLNEQCWDEHFLALKSGDQHNNKQQCVLVGSQEESNQELKPQFMVHSSSKEQYDQQQQVLTEKYDSPVQHSRHQMLFPHLQRRIQDCLYLTFCVKKT